VGSAEHVTTCLIVTHGYSWAATIREADHNTRRQIPYAGGARFVKSTIELTRQGSVYRDVGTFDDILTSGLLSVRSCLCRTHHHKQPLGLDVHGFLALHVSTCTCVGSLRILQMGQHARADGSLKYIRIVSKSFPSGEAWIPLLVGFPHPTNHTSGPLIDSVSNVLIRTHVWTSSPTLGSWTFADHFRSPILLDPRNHGLSVTPGYTL
jgi:hypothetical protein